MICLIVKRNPELPQALLTRVVRTDFETCQSAFRLCTHLSLHTSSPHFGSLDCIQTVRLPITHRHVLVFVFVQCIHSWPFLLLNEDGAASRIRTHTLRLRTPLYIHYTIAALDLSRWKNRVDSFDRICKMPIFILRVLCVNYQLSFFFCVTFCNDHILIRESV